MPRGSGQHFRGGRVRQTIIEMENAFLFVIAAGRGTCLWCRRPPTLNAVPIAYEYGDAVRRMGKYLAAEPRFPVDEHEME